MTRLEELIEELESLNQLSTECSDCTYETQDFQITIKSHTCNKCKESSLILTTTE